MTWHLFFYPMKFTSFLRRFLMGNLTSFFPLGGLSEHIAQLIINNWVLSCRLQCQDILILILRFSNQHSDFFHWITEAMPSTPVDSIRPIYVCILPIKICLVAGFVPPTAFSGRGTVVNPLIIVGIVGAKNHPIVVRHAVSWKPKLM